MGFIFDGLLRRYIMSRGKDCKKCPVAKKCHYFYKPCNCKNQEKFWTKKRRKKFEQELTGRE
jgi:hypothetical protein